MSPANWFNSFCDNLKITNEIGISLRYKAITRRLNKDFWQTESETAHSLYVGSYGRNTATGGFSDLDMIMQLPYSVYLQHNSYSSNGQSALLQAVKNR
jgi:tRNA nucleotidyltransferase (CCA-adding enzyme)